MFATTQCVLLTAVEALKLFFLDAAARGQLAPAKRHKVPPHRSFDPAQKPGRRQQKTCRKHGIVEWLLGTRIRGPSVLQA